MKIEERKIKKDDELKRVLFNTQINLENILSKGKGMIKINTGIS